MAPALKTSQYRVDCRKNSNLGAVTSSLPASYTLLTRVLARIVSGLILTDLSLGFLGYYVRGNMCSALSIAGLHIDNRLRSDRVPE